MQNLEQVFFERLGDLEKSLFERINTSEQTIRELNLKIQQLEDRLSSLENGEFGTGIYLDGCSEGDKKYIAEISKKVGE